MTAPLRVLWERREVLRIMAAAAAMVGGAGMARAAAGDAVTLILRNGKFTTLDSAKPAASAVAIAGDRFAAVGGESDVMPLAGPTTRMIDLGGRRVIPGLMDSHTHVIRGGLYYNMELRWDGVPSLADAMPE